MLASFDGPVIMFREFWKPSTSQQEALKSEGVRREWERSPLAGHALLFMQRAWDKEIPWL